MGTFCFGGMHHQWQRNVRDRAEFQGYQLSWSEKACLLSRETLWCLWWLQPFFPWGSFGAVQTGDPTRSLLGLNPQAKHGEMPDPSHHLLIPGSKSLGVQKFWVMAKTFPPSYSYAILHLLNRRSELSRVSPLAASWTFQLLFWLFSGLKHQVWFAHSSSRQTPMYRAVRACFCWGNRTVQFSSLQHSAHDFFSECCPLHL